MPSVALTANFSNARRTAGPKQIGKFEDWTAATHSESGQTVCYAFTRVQSSDSVAGSTTFDVTSHATGRYVLIWITDLPPLAGSPGRYETMIYNITARGFTSG